MTRPKDEADQGPSDDKGYFGFLVLITLILAAVFLTWSWTIYSPTGLFLQEKVDLDARGNLLGALFSGLAFVGVVGAIYLQWKELGYQRQELKETKEAMQKSAATQEEQTKELREQTEQLRQQVIDQRIENAANSRARGLQSREQFLTARLSATNASLQAHELYLKQLIEHKYLFSLTEMVKQTRKIRQQIAILLCEAKLGFDGGEWTPAVERRAIREYLLTFFHDIQSDHPAPIDANYNSFVSFVETAKAELKLLIYQYQSTQPKVAGTVESLLRTMATIDLNPPPSGPLSEVEKLQSGERFLKMVAGFSASALSPVFFE